MLKTLRPLALPVQLSRRQSPHSEVLRSAVAIGSPVSSRTWWIQLFGGLLRVLGFGSLGGRLSGGRLVACPNHRNRFCFTATVIVFDTLNELITYSIISS